MGIYYDFSANHYKEFCSKIKDKPVFVSRIGGSDFNAVCMYKTDKKSYNYELFNNICSNYNGYFDKETDINIRNDNFIKYLDTLFELYKKQKITSVMADIYDYNIKTFIYDNKPFLEDVVFNKELISYLFFEEITPFLDNFETLTKNKKVLFISPFSKSIEYQYQRKDKLLNNYTLPDFHLLTYNTPITYNNQDGNIINVSTNNWFEQCELMAKEISEIDFDIAFLSCGSYALYLGDFIAEKLGKTSFYLGGVLNVIFNIAGTRYNNCKYYKDMMNMENQIVAFEKDDYANISAGRGIHSEGFKAYF